jgi:RecB family exonuclease
VIETAFKELIRRDPVLVVPGVDDIFGWEERLTRELGAMVGGQVVHFRDLCSEIIARSDAGKMDTAGELQRLALVNRAIRDANAKLASRLEEQPGIANAVLELIDDFRAELIDPPTLEANISAQGLGGLGWLSATYRGYIGLLEERRLTDGPNEVSRALGLVSADWARRPVFVAGFDDMTRQQLEMVRSLAVEQAAEVTVAVSFEEQNPALELSNRLMAELRELGRATTLRETATGRGETETPHEPALVELERRFLRVDPESDDALSATDAVTVMRSSGARNEAEAIGAEIARLVAEGVPPEEIAIAVSVPADNGPVTRDVLERYGIPVALESETAVRGTTVGAMVLSILGAVRPGAGPRAAFEWLRGPLGPDPELVDRLEFESVVASDTSAESVIGRLRKLGGENPPGWADLNAALRDGKPVNQIVSRLAAELASAVLASDTAPIPSSATVTEAQAGTAISAACEELESIQDSRDTGLEEIRMAIESGAVKLWSVPAAGTVRIASPYSLRAKRFAHLFMASQQEGGLHDTERAGPFLSAKDRGALGMRERIDPEIQSRYLFYSCLTVPTDGLWISCRTSDEAGKAEQPSPLIAAVEALFECGPGGEPGVATGGRLGSDIVFNPADAPTLREAGRAVAVAGEGTVPELGEYTEGVEQSLSAARMLEQSTRRLASLSEEVAAEIARDPVFSPTAVEAFASCPYEWFIERQLAPQQFGPDPDYLTLGTLLHGVLETVYGRFPDQVPQRGTVDRWIEQLPEIVEEQSARWQVRLDGPDPVSTGQRMKAQALVSAHLKREAAKPVPTHLPAMLEYSFGTKGSEVPAVDMGGWKLRGMIDRVDLCREETDDSRPEAVVVDYKSGKVDDLTHLKSKEKRRLQLQLYMHAIKVAGYEPVAGLYVSLRADAGASRGAYSPSVAKEMRARGASKNDVYKREADGEETASGIDHFIEEGLRRANESVQQMLLGILDHDPATCPNHFDHPAVPDRPDEDDEQNGGSD